MTAKIVTDSASDLSPEIALSLGVTVVPVYVRFGDRVYRDRVDIDANEFYRIFSIHLTSNLSATYSAALRGKELTGQPECRIEVMDSQSLTIGLGLITIAAAKAAQAEENIAGVREPVRHAISRTHLRGLLNTLKHALKGGRLGKAAALLGTMLKRNPHGVSSP